MSDVRVIKRYQNRKLYDTTDSCYVTLDDISDMIKQGEDIQVIDNTNKDDLTSVTLAQIIFEAEKRQQNVLPLDTLINIVRSSGETIREIAHKAIETGAHFVDDTIKPAVKGVQKIPTVQHEIQSLLNRIEDLEKRLDTKE